MKKLLLKLSLLSIFNCYPADTHPSVISSLELDSNAYLIKDASAAFFSFGEALKHYETDPINHFTMHTTNRKNNTNATIDLMKLKATNGFEFLGCFLGFSLDTIIGHHTNSVTILGETHVKNSNEKSLNDCLIVHQLVVITKNKVRKLKLKQSLPICIAALEISKHGTPANKGDFKATMQKALSKSQA